MDGTRRLYSYRMAGVRSGLCQMHVGFNFGLQDSTSRKQKLVALRVEDERTEACWHYDGWSTMRMW